MRILFLLDIEIYGILCAYATTNYILHILNIHTDCTNVTSIFYVKRAVIHLTLYNPVQLFLIIMIFIHFNNTVLLDY